MYIHTGNLLCCQYMFLSESIFSFQACKRVRHLGCLSAQAVDSRYDKSFLILLVW